MGEADIRQVLRDIRNLPHSDYRLNSTPTTEPNGNFKGSVKLINTFARLAFPKFAELGDKSFVSVEPKVQLVLVSNQFISYHFVESAALAIFPVFEPAFIGLGGISLGRYMHTQEVLGRKTEVIEPKIRKAELFILSRKNPEKGLYITVQDGKHTGIQYSAFYRVGTVTKLDQFGKSDEGWFMVNPLLKGIITFPNEESVCYGGAGVLDMTYPIKTITERYEQYTKIINNLGIKFTDDHAENGTLAIETLSK